MLVVLKVTSNIQCYLKYKKHFCCWFFLTTNIIRMVLKKNGKHGQYRSTNMQQPMFYILLQDYFISHQLLTRHCSLHMFWMGKQIMQVKVKFSVFRTIWGFNFIPWERVIFFDMGSFSWKGKATPEKNWKMYNTY